jgi:hypothetical protein
VPLDLRRLGTERRRRTTIRDPLIARLLDKHRDEPEDHPMRAVLTEGLTAPPRARRRGGRAARISRALEIFYRNSPCVLSDRPLLSSPCSHGSRRRAQTQDEPVFASYEEMRATLDDLMSKRQIADLLTAFGGADEMTPQDMTVLETQVRNIFPDDFENSP